MILEKTLIMSNLNMFYKWYKQCKRGYIGVAPHAQHSSQQHCGGQILPCPSNVATSYKTYTLHLAFSQEITQNCNDDLYIDIDILKNIMFCRFIFSPFFENSVMLWVWLCCAGRWPRPRCNTITDNKHRLICTKYIEWAARNTTLL